MRGVKGLRISLELTKTMLRPYARVTHTKRLDSYDDADQYLSNHYGDLLTFSRRTFSDWQKAEYNFKPFGTMINSFIRKENNTRYFEIYRVSTQDVGFLKSGMHDCL